MEHEVVTVELALAKSVLQVHAVGADRAVLFSEEAGSR